jgi:hypothetical protein
MPRVERIRKNRAGKERKCGKCGKVIQPGEHYLKWEFRYGGAHYRCTAHPPRPSDLTQSKLSTVYAAIEQAEDELPTLASADDIEATVQGVADVVTDVVEEYRDAAEPFGGEGENAERADELEGWAEELAGFDASEADSEDYDSEDDRLEAVRATASEALSGCPL